MASRGNLRDRFSWYRPGSPTVSTYTSFSGTPLARARAISSAAVSCEIWFRLYLDLCVVWRLR
jgi:hypothetical protein